MATDAHTPEPHEPGQELTAVEMPRPTSAPLVLAVGMALVASGVAFGAWFLVIGVIVLVVGLGAWIAQLLPGRGHFHEPLAHPSRRARPVAVSPGRVEHLRQGMPGYRIRLPQEVHPISAGIKGGIVGGLAIPVPALLWGYFSGRGIWFPVNLLAGMVVPGVGRMSVADLSQFHPTLFGVAVVIHITMSVVMGLIYGVLLPTLPSMPRPIAWGGFLMPLLWMGTSYPLMRILNPVMSRHVSWPWFIFSQLVFGLVAAVVVMREGNIRPATGIIGGLMGGLLMPIPAILWSLLTGHGLWYPVNLLAGLTIAGIGKLPLAELKRFHADWFLAALAVHAVLSIGFGLLYALLLPRLPPIPSPVAWGGLVLPLLWTGTSYGLMGVANPALQHEVDWPWFVVSQFVFGIVAALVVLRSEMVEIPPAGRGPDRLSEFVLGEEGAQP